MAKDIRTKAHLQGGEIRTKANFGQTVAITVLPDPYEGQTTVTPSDERQTLPTRGKTVATDITVLPAPVESLATSENGTFLPSSGNVGFSEVVVDVEPLLESLSVTENGLYLPESGTDGFDRVSVDVPPTVPVLQGKAVNPSETAQTVTPDSGYDGLSAVDVGAIPSSYVGSDVTRRSSSDLTASGNTVSVPSGYYESSGSKSVQTGTAGTPTASKSAVSNHSIAVTPSVSNTEGYISSGTLTGNAVTVSASELVSGTENITANGTYDVVNKASAVVNVPSQAPVLDSLSVTENGTYTPESGVDGFNEVVVNVPTGGEIEWDGVIYPVTDESDQYYADHVFNPVYIPNIYAGDTVIIEALGRGTLFAFRGGQPTSGYMQEYKIGGRTDSNVLVRFTLNITADSRNFIIGGYQWSGNGSHSGYDYNCGYGEYIKWKVIHAS